jgi:hypothetical protein
MEVALFKTESLFCIFLASRRADMKLVCVIRDSEAECYCKTNDQYRSVPQ